MLTFDPWLEVTYFYLFESISNLKAVQTVRNTVTGSLWLYWWWHHHLVLKSWLHDFIGIFWSYKCLFIHKISKNQQPRQWSASDWHCCNVTGEVAWRPLSLMAGDTNIISSGWYFKTLIPTGLLLHSSPSFLSSTFLLPGQPSCQKQHISWLMNQF